MQQVWGTWTVLWIVLEYHVFSEWMPKYLYTLRQYTYMWTFAAPPSLNIISQLNEKLDIYCGFYSAYNLCGAKTCIPLLDNKCNPNIPVPKTQIWNLFIMTLITFFHLLLLFVNILNLCSWICSGIGSVTRRCLMYSAFCCQNGMFACVLTVWV